jgi:nucleoside-diphosphate-sugar epimerase
MGSRQRVISMIYIADLVQAMLQAASIPPSDNNVYFITDGKLYPWKEVVETTAKILNVRFRSVRIPDGFLFFLGLLMDFVSIYLTKAPLLDSQRIIESRQSNWTASSKKFFDRFEFQPQYDLQKGLEETVNWHNKQSGR